MGYREALISKGVSLSFNFSYLCFIIPLLAQDFRCKIFNRTIQLSISRRKVYTFEKVRGILSWELQTFLLTFNTYSKSQISSKMSDTQQQTSTDVAPAQQNGPMQPAQQQEQQMNNTYIPPRAEGYRTSAIRESRIKDRPYNPVEASLKIKIELDLEVEVGTHSTNLVESNTTNFSW